MAQAAQYAGQGGGMSSGTGGVLNEVRSIVVKVRRRVLSVPDMLVAVACKVEDELRLDTGLSLPSLQLFCARCVLGAFVVGTPAAFVEQLLAAVPDAARPQARAAARRLLRAATASHHTLASFFAQQDQRDAPAPLAPVPAQSFLRRLAAQWRAYGYREQALCYESLAPALSAALEHPLLAREAFADEETEEEEEEDEEEEESSQESDGDADAYFNTVVRSVGVAGSRGASSPETGVDLAAKLQKKGPATRVQAAPEAAAVQAVEEALRCGVVDGVAVGPAAAAAASAGSGVEDAEAGRRRLMASNTHVLVRYLGEAGYRSEAVEAALAHCSEVITKNADSLTHGVAGAGAGAAEADGGSGGGGGSGAAGGPASVPHLFSYDVLCGSAGAEAPRLSKMPLKNLCGATLVHIAYLHAKYADAASAKLCIDEAVKAGLNLSNPSLISASCHLNVLLCLKNQGAPFPGCHHLSRSDACPEAEQAGPAAPTAAAAAQAAPQQNQQQSAAADAFAELVYTLRVANGASPAIHAQLQLTLAVLCLNFPVLSSAYAEQLSEFVPGLRRDVVCWHHHNGGDGLPPAMPPAAGGGGGGGGDDAPQAPAAPPVDRGETVIEGFSGGHAGCYHRGQQHGRNIGGVIGAATAVGDGQGGGGVSAAHAATVAQAFLRGARGAGAGGSGTGTEASAAEVRSILAAPEAAWAWTSVGGDGVHYPLVPQILCALREAALHSATANPQFATAPSLADYYGRRGAAEEGVAGGGFGLSHGAAWAAATIAVVKSQVYDMAGLHDVALAALREGVDADGPLSLHGRNRVLQLVVHNLFVRMDPVAAADACLSLRAAHGGAAATAPLWEPRFQQASSLVLAYFLLHYGSDPAAAVRVLRRALALQTQGLPTPDSPVVLQPYLGLLLVACYLHPALADHEAALHECMASLESAREACLSRWVVVFQIQAVKVHLHCECGGMAARFLLNALRTADDADLCTERAEALAASVAHHLACDDVARAHTLLASVHAEHGSHTTADVRFQLCLLAAQTLMRIAVLLADGTYTSDVRRDLSTPPPAPRAAAAAAASDERSPCASAAAAEVEAGSAFLPDLDWTRKDEDEATAGVWFPGPTGDAVRLRERGGALRLALAHLRHAAEGRCLPRGAATQAVPPLLAYQAHALHAELREMAGEHAERDAAAVAALQGLTQVMAPSAEASAVAEAVEPEAVEAAIEGFAAKYRRVSA